MDNSSELREIEQQRIRILSSIRAIRRQSSAQSSPSDAKTNNGNSANESQKLQNLYEQYAKLLQKRGALQRRKLHDPLTSLPAELWQECLSYVASEEKGPDQVLTLLLVSKTWRQTLLRVPALWSTIVLDDNPDVLHRLSACIFLSGTLPLTVRIQLPPKSPFIDADADPPSIIPNTAYTTLLEPETRKRIKRIVFTQSVASQRAHKQGDDGPFIAFYDTAFSLLKPFEDLETLEEVRMQHEFDYYSRTLLEPGFPIAPKLRGVWRWCLPGVTLERMMRDLDANNGFYYKFVLEQEDNDEKPTPGPIYSGMSELRHLSTNMTVESACQLLPKLPSLQHLMLTSPHARDQFPFTEPSSYTDPTLLGTLASTRLTMLECSQLIAPAHHPLFHLPSLTVLCLDLTWPSLSSFLGSFSVLPNLKRLELGMKESDELAHGSSQEKSGGFVLPSVLPDLSSVQTLILQNYDTDYWPLGDDGSDSISSNSDAEDDNSQLNGTESPNASSSPTSTGYRRAHTSSPVPPPRRPASPMFAQLLFACRSMLCGVQDLTLTFRIRVSIWPVLSYLSSLANVLERICVSGMLSTSKRKALLASRNIPHAYRPLNGSSQSSFPTCVPLPTLKELTAFTSSILNFIDAPNLQTLHCPDPIPPAVPSMYFNGLKPLSGTNHNAKKFATRELSAPAPLSSSQPPHSLKRTSKAKRRPRHVQLRAGPLLNKAILHPAQAPLLSVVNTTNLRILYWVGGNEEIRAVPQIDWEEEDRPTAVQQPSTSTSHAEAGNTESKDETTEPERKYGGKGQEASIFPPGVAVQSLRIASLHDIKFGSEAIMPEVLRFLEGLGRVESKHEEDEDEEDGQRSRCRWPCPELETIAFGGYPAFDLLLRVLESRNMWCGETTENEDRIVGQMGVGDSKLRSIKGKGKAKELTTSCGPKRITKILLPGYPAPDTLSSIVRFLGQRLTMPDDGDGVSFSYDERYFREDV
ncbi:hypothetical protein FRC15_001816 [Serendipita sp. 397]|nr:hypothetical protein FRC15_001816 [Serendipita sp. 397]